MSFTGANVGNTAARLKRAAGDLMGRQSVDLYEGPAVELKLHIGTRGASENVVTSGAHAEASLIATIDAEDWDAKADRGDVIHWVGKRYAVRDVHVAAPAGIKVFYKTRLGG
jgi:hypothetical protein